ncbi:hypothetical protein SAMN05421738_106116 [Algoriella xinjiangensis]|uniref:Phage integrase family protein n=1 Tax=Algoriella xinjiangensis TaxID=684065 RepID=A0A1I4W2Z4_9FLAO|nr:hypothetical protein [Algoriella xinjiangensis]SFN07918.1 hypothetical protein SAMN05421738_106116 [Algoriella xinjiangensis]
MINFVLKEKILGKKSAVSALISGEFSPTKKNDRIKLALGVSVTPETFGTSAGNYTFDPNHLVKGRSFEANHLRDKIHQITVKHDVLSSYYKVSGKLPSKLEFENKLTELLVKDNIITKKGYQKIDFENYGKHFFDDFLKDLIAKEVDDYKNGNREFALSTIKIHQNVYNHLLNYQEYKGQRLYIENIKVKTLLEIIDVANGIMIGEIKIKKNYCSNQNKSRNKFGYSVNFVNNLLAQFKSFLRKVDTDEIELSINLAASRLKRKKAQSAKKVYYNNDLLEEIYLHRPLIKRTARARDYILLASTLGMRHQSVSLLYKEQVKQITTKDGSIFYAIINKSSKTGIEIISPLFAPAMEIYRNNNNSFPKVFLTNYLSKALRDLFTEMKIKDKTIINEWVHIIGIVTTERNVAEVVSSHDCRKTFVTNLLQLGVNSSVVRSMTHETLEENSSSFNVYDNACAVDRAKTFYNSTKNLDSIIYKY